MYQVSVWLCHTHSPIPLNLLYSLHQATLMSKFIALLNSWCSQINPRFLLLTHSRQYFPARILFITRPTMKSHIGTASYLPESHVFQMLLHQPTAQICPPVQDRLTVGPQSLKGFPGSLGLRALKFCFLPKTSPHLITCAAHLCSPPTASAAMMPQAPLSSQSCLHKVLLGQPGMHPACGRRLVTRAWPDQHRQTSRD